MTTVPRGSVSSPEFSRPFAVSAIGTRGAEITVEAGAGECTALALRFSLPAIEALRCRFSLAEASGGAITVEGTLQARIVQDCVVSLEPFASDVDETFSVRFVPEDRLSDDVDPEGEDEIGFSGGTIDLGEAAAEQLALGLDPYPRRPGAVLETPDEPAPSGPFAALRMLPRDE